MRNKCKVPLADSALSCIVTIRGQKVILDSDLAEIYGVETKRLNEQVKRNAKRFPPDFLFRLDAEEVDCVVSQGTAEINTGVRSQIATALNWSQIATSSSKHRGRVYRPYAFTEHGAIMAASVLNSDKAIGMSVFVVRAFIKMREQLVQKSNMEVRLTQVEKTLLQHDAALRDLYQKLRPLLLPPPDPPKKPIGFHAKESRGRYRVAKKGKVAK